MGMKLNYLNINLKLLRSAGLVNANSKKGLVVKNTAAQSVRSEENYGILLTTVS